MPDIVFPLVLDIIHQFVCGLDGFFDTVGSREVGRQTDAECYLPLVSLHDVQELFMKFLGYQGRGLLSCFNQQDNKFISTEACDNIDGTDMLLDGFSHFDQQMITGVMT